MHFCFPFFVFFVCQYVREPPTAIPGFCTGGGGPFFLNHHTHAVTSWQRPAKRSPCIRRGRGDSSRPNEAAPRERSAARSHAHCMCVHVLLAQDEQAGTVDAEGWKAGIGPRRDLGTSHAGISRQMIAFKAPGAATAACASCETSHRARRPPTTPPLVASAKKDAMRRTRAQQRTIVERNGSTQEAQQEARERALPARRGHCTLRGPRRNASVVSLCGTAAGPLPRALHRGQSLLEIHPF